MTQGWLEALRTWWIWHKQAAGLVIGGLALVSITLLAMPIMAATNAHGTVVGFRSLSLETGNETYAVVDVSGRQSMVRLDPESDCTVGSSIKLRKLRAVAGVRYTAPRGCRAAGRVPDNGH
jgi:hypothetical protein